jgi:hypothetical protein
MSRRGSKKKKSAMKYMNFTTVFDSEIQLPYFCLEVIKPDSKFEKISHIKTNFKDKKGKPLWFNVKHSFEEVLDMYFQVKRAAERR